MVSQYLSEHCHLLRIGHTSNRHGPSLTVSSERTIANDILRWQFTASFVTAWRERLRDCVCSRPEGSEYVQRQRTSYAPTVAHGQECSCRHLHHRKPGFDPGAKLGFQPAIAHLRSARDEARNRRKIGQPCAATAAAAPPATVVPMSTMSPERLRLASDALQPPHALLADAVGASCPKNSRVAAQRGSVH